MNIIQKIERLKRLDQLIRLKATGSPKELSYKMGISRSVLLEDINILKLFGAKIDYCRIRRTYFHEKQGRFIVTFDEEHLNQKEQQKVRAGLRKFSFFHVDGFYHILK